MQSCLNLRNLELKVNKSTNPRRRLPGDFQTSSKNVPLKKRAPEKRSSQSGATELHGDASFEIELDSRVVKGLASGVEEKVETISAIVRKRIYITIIVAAIGAATALGITYVGKQTQIKDMEADLKGELVDSLRLRIEDLSAQIEVLRGERSALRNENRILQDRIEGLEKHSPARGSENQAEKSLRHICNNSNFWSNTSYCKDFIDQ